MLFSGTGTWNRTPNCAFEVKATDQGEPGRRHETFEMKISCAGLTIPTTFLSGGNIQSTRIIH